MSDKSISPERLRREIQLRMDRALANIERAQRNLESATADLSTLIGAVPALKATSRMSDRVGKLWWKVDKYRFRNLALDTLTIEHILKSE